MRLVLLIVDERCNRAVLSDAEHRTAFQPARPQRSQGYDVSTVRLSKCKKLHSIRHSTTRASDWPSRQHADWDKWDKHFGVRFYTVASLLHFRQYAFLRDSVCLSLPACLHIYSMNLTQGGEDGKRRSNCTLTFTRHWTTFFGTRVQTCDLSCQSMIHAFVSRCQKEEES